MALEQQLAAAAQSAVPAVVEGHAAAVTAVVPVAVGEEAVEAVAEAAVVAVAVAVEAVEAVAVARGCRASDASAVYIVALHHCRKPEQRSCI